MITRDELKTVEQETKTGWKGILALTAVVRHSASMTDQRVVQTPPVLFLVNGDDHEMVDLSSALESHGIATGVAKTLEEAATLIANDSVRIVVVDEVFVASASDCWKLRRHKVLPVVLMGSKPEREGWDKAVNLEADAYLPKLMSRAEQVARIKALLRRS